MTSEQYVASRVLHLLDWHQRLRGRARSGAKADRLRWRRLADRVEHLIGLHMQRARQLPL